MKFGQIGIWAVIILMLMSSPTAAQDPPLAPFFPPAWSVDIATNTMSLSPVTAHLAVGVDEADVALHVVGDSLTTNPNTGSLVIGPPSGVHMQFDRNDIRVAGSSADTVGALYFQRYGGPVVIHGSEPLESRIYVTSDGELGSPRPIRGNSLSIVRSWGLLGIPRPALSRLTETSIPTTSRAKQLMCWTV